MIKDPPLLRIRRGFTRPSEALLAGFAGIPTGYLVDAMNGSGCLDYRIKPLVALFGAVHAARKGDVLVAATDAYMGAAITGDLLLGMARNRGVAGLVTDGLVRDLVGILDVDIPVYCAGLTANSPARNGPGTVGLPIVLGGVRVDSGDIVVGDRDGIVIVPLAEATNVLGRLGGIKAAEASLEAKVKAGLEVPDFIQAIMESGRVEEIS
jgi:4-hydroxy-4-methyl-2-oxoglutarate aldolase